MILILIIGILQSCRDPFEPDLSPQSVDFLVVEGYIEVSGESQISLGRTSPINSNTAPILEEGARVFLSDNLNLWDFEEKGNGQYTLNGNFDPTKEYTLSIWLKNGKQYTSDPMIPIISPEIEELAFVQDNDGVEIYISTKGEQEKQYFMWSYEEHWIFNSGVRSFLIYEEGSIRIRNEDERVDRCWKDNINPKILLQDAARFEDNRILQRELIRIPPRSEKLTNRYSVLVKQRAIDQDAFNFWEILRKNSDDIGGIFSPLPSLITGNIQNTEDSSEKVIGFISMGKSSNKRLYINASEVFPWPVFIPEYEYCQILQDTIPPTATAIRDAFNNGVVVPAIDIWDGIFLIGYRGADYRCVDCTLRGTNVRPEFWED